MNTATMRVGTNASARRHLATPSTLPEIIATKNGWPLDAFRGAYTELIAMGRERGWSQEQFNGAAAELTAVPPRPDMPGRLNAAGGVPPAPAILDKVLAARALSAPFARPVPAPVARVRAPLAEDVTAQPRRAVVADPRPIPPARPIAEVLAARRVAAGAA